MVAFIIPSIVKAEVKVALHGVSRIICNLGQ